MFRYRFTGHHPRHLDGLAWGVNAHVESNAGAALDVDRPREGVIVAHPGDLIVTEAAYPHPEMSPDDDATQAAHTAATAPSAAPEPSTVPQEPPSGAEAVAAPQPVTWTPPPAE